ncbi:DUF4124 domain-containing protein [Dyella jejuensis]|uniref:DUF4124 domain-containing protein n=1 Tax=Dyella jejuensis TaxID=1432009 RepID=A0ABW8JIQ3_9GAMM
MSRVDISMLLLAILFIAGQPDAAQAGTTTVYKCSSAKGQVVYQGTPCARSQQQRTMQLEDNGPATSPLSEPVDDTASAMGATRPAPRPLREPPPPMYRCLDAVNHNTYLSSHGDPQPYYAPLAVTGMIPTSLGQPSVPPGRGRATAATVASHYVLVRDTCAPMTPADTCAALRDQYDENERKLSRAFKSDQPPLLQRESELMAALAHC